MRRYAEIAVRLITEDVDPKDIERRVRDALLNDPLIDAGEVDVVAVLGDEITINKHGYAVAQPLLPKTGAEMKYSEYDIQDFVRAILRWYGENPDRPGLVETPRRVVAAWVEMFLGYTLKAESVLKSFEDITADEMIVVRDVEFYSTCEHHMLPFIGVAHFGYLPDKKVVGLSKIGRLVDVFARRLQVQERLTEQIVSSFEEHIKPKGVGCVIEAKHLCMMCRGVMKQKSEMVTCALRGVFKTDPSTRSEFFNHCYRRRGCQ